MLEAAGFDEVVTVEAHRPDTVATLWPLPLRSLSVAPLFQPFLEKGAGGTTVIVAPDAGALALCQSIGDESGSHGVVCFSKERTEQGIAHIDTPLVNVKRAMVVDDMLDTGGTLISCCQHLVEQGVEEIVVMVAHGLFTGEAWPRLFALPVTTLYCTDSLPLPALAANYPIEQLTMAPLLTKKALEGEA
jgi:ribose-phosphate pyrophosphokinase